MYVQDRLAESATLVWDLLERGGAHFYVCGDAGAMAAAVERQLLQIIQAGLQQQQQPQQSQDDAAAAAAAAAYLERLAQAGRYQRDVWLS